MNEEIFLSALRENPNDEVTWLALADWLEENGQTDRSELVRLVRRLRTFPAMKRTRTRVIVEERIANLLRAGCRPVVPEIVNTIGMRLALIGPGRFRMGSPSTERLRQITEFAHEVEITRPFYMGVFPVTQSQYEAVMGTNPSHFSATGTGKDRVGGLDTRDFPVEKTSRDDAVAFCEELSNRPAEKMTGRKYRLPSEAEWEYACRAGTSTVFPLGDSLPADLANYDSNRPYTEADHGPSRRLPSVVGSYPPNAWGLYDLAGNVWEWVNDWHDGYSISDSYYRVSPRTDPPGPAETRVRLIRGGSWEAEARDCRCAARTARYGHVNLDDHGFRVMTVSPK